MKLRIKRLKDQAQQPKYATDGAGCFDIHACLPPGVSIVVRRGEPARIPTGWAIEVPDGWVLEVYSRSGHGFKDDTRLANCVGIIDADYRGELMVKLTRDIVEAEGAEPFIIRHGDRIAQGKLVQAPRCTFDVVDLLSETARGSGGFGSTGHN